MHFLYPQLVVWVCTICYAVTHVHGSQCQPFQTYATPRNSDAIPSFPCSVYTSSGCCDSGTGFRAFNWAREDDGCGVVHDTCLQMSIDLACWRNCSPDLVLTTNNATGVPKPQVTPMWAQRIYDACKTTQWCGGSQALVSSCSYFEVKYKRKTAITIKEVTSTCTLIQDLTAGEFARSMLGIEVSATASTSDDPPFQSTSSATSRGISYALSLCVFFSCLVTMLV